MKGQRLSPPWKTRTRDLWQAQDSPPSLPPMGAPPGPESRLCPRGGSMGVGGVLRSQGQGVKPAAEKFVVSALSYLPLPRPACPPQPPPQSSSCPAPPPFSIWKKEACCLCILTVAKRLNCLRAGSLGWLDEPEETKIDILILPCSPGLRPPGGC